MYIWLYHNALTKSQNNTSECHKCHLSATKIHRRQQMTVLDNLRWSPLTILDMIFYFIFMLAIYEWRSSTIIKWYLLSAYRREKTIFVTFALIIWWYIFRSYIIYVHDQTKITHDECKTVTIISDRAIACSHVTGTE